MIEIRNITKIYHSKTGASVKALDNVSVTFPERGMVFILGKSGSGKSTLLNVIGGLDGCDGGEFIIKGKSSKDFVGSDFDAYRNTFIGFIFQEYNILDEFSVGANIGLALELQGKKATNDKINQILADVDLLDYAKRKPNELSGGQKQRVAIARALVKDPEIIMADEPTGALDSNTGKQIFDTLKELSKTKLVIVVSHDTDFAEKYGDRIIEMKDGQIFRDVTKHEVAAVQMSRGILKMTDNLLRIEHGYQLTASDLTLINEYLAKQKADILISGDERLNDGVRTEAGISQNNCTAVFGATDPEKDIKLLDYDGKKTKFIKSRLPMKNAIKMGKSGLGHKKVRLVLTIFLSLIAFALFGFADTLGAYDKITAATESIVDSHVQNASFSLSLKSTYSSEDYSYDYFNNTALNSKDLKLLSERTGLSFVPVFNGSTEPRYSNIPVTSNMVDMSKISSSAAYTGSLYGFAAMNESEIRKLGFTIHGDMPTSDEEIAISKFMYEQFNYTGFRDAVSGKEIDAKSLTYIDGDADSIIGKNIRVSMNGRDYTFKVTAVIDTSFEYERYQKYIPSTNASETPTVQTESDTIVDMIMQNELMNTLRYGFHAIGYVTNGAIDTMSENMMYYGEMNSVGTWMNWTLEMQLNTPDGMGSQHFSRIASFEEVEDLLEIEWIDDNEKLGSNEILISKNRSNIYYNPSIDIYEKLQQVRADVLGDVNANVREYAINKYMSENFTTGMQAALRSAFISDKGYTPGSTDELWNYWYQLIEWGDASRVNSKSAWELENEMYKALIAALFGDDVANVNDQVLSNFRRFFEHGESNFSLDDAKRYIAYKYAVETLDANPEIMDKEAFTRYIISAYGNLEYWNSTRLTPEEKRQMAIDALANTIVWNSVDQNCSEKWYTRGVKAVEDGAVKLYCAVTGDSATFNMSDIVIVITTWDENGENRREYSDFEVAGYFKDTTGNISDLIVSNKLYEMHKEYADSQNWGTTVTTPHEMGIYAFAIAPMPTDRASIQKLVELNYTEIDGLKFQLQNQVMDTLNSFNDFIEIGAKVFLYVGIGFAVFAGLMLMNFISVSISYKRREIGILRAVGARSSDVFKIFFSEAAIIALINYVLSLVATIVGVGVFNNVVRNRGVNVTLLNFGIRQIVLMLFVSLFVAAVSSFLPVWNIARRKPVDAIKNK